MTTTLLLTQLNLTMPRHLKNHVPYWPDGLARLDSSSPTASLRPRLRRPSAPLAHTLNRLRVLLLTLAGYAVCHTPGAAPSRDRPPRRGRTTAERRQHPSHATPTRPAAHPRRPTPPPIADRPSARRRTEVAARAAPDVRAAIRARAPSWCAPPARPPSATLLPLSSTRTPHRPTDRPTDTHTPAHPHTRSPGMTC